MHDLRISFIVGHNTFPIIIATNEGITKELSIFNITTFVYSVRAKTFKFVRIRIFFV